MAIMNSCCCCSTMKSACKASGIYLIVISILTLLWVVYPFIIAGSWIAYYSEYAKTLYILWIVSVVMEVILLVSGSLLVAGAGQNYSGRHLVLASVILTAVYLLYHIGSNIYYYYYVHKLVGRLFWQFFFIFNLVAWLIPLIFKILALFCSIALYQQLQEEGPHYDGRFHNRQPVISMTTHPGGYPNAHSDPYPQPYSQEWQEDRYPTHQNKYREGYPQYEPKIYPYEKPYGKYEGYDPGLPADHGYPSYHNSSSRPSHTYQHSSRAPPHLSRYDRHYGRREHYHDRY